MTAMKFQRLCLFTLLDSLQSVPPLKFLKSPVDCKEHGARNWDEKDWDETWEQSVRRETKLVNGQSRAGFQSSGSVIDHLIQELDLSPPSSPLFLLL